MSELLAKVEWVAHSIELYEDELRVQLPLAPKCVVPLMDVVDLEFRRAWFFLAGKLIVVFREGDELKKVYTSFNFLASKAVESMVATMIERLASVYKNPGAIEFLSMAGQEDEMVQCPNCSAMMLRGMTVCPGCGIPRL